MVRVIFERAVNFEDVTAIVFNQDEVKLDQLVLKGFNTKSTPAAEAEVEDLLEDMKALEQLSSYTLCPTKTCSHQRAILFSLLIFMIQHRRVFTQEQVLQLVSILNHHQSQNKVVMFEISTPSSLFRALQKGGEHFEKANYSMDQIKLLEDSVETFIYVGICLANYLSMEAISVYMITSFGLYLEAIKSDLKFLDELKMWNTENRQLVDVISKIENFLDGRQNNSKSKSTPEQQRYILFLRDFYRELSQIKQSLKEYLSVEKNNSTKNYYYESSMVKNWRSLGFGLQSITNVIVNSFSVQLYLLNDLVKQALDGENKKVMEGKIASFAFSNPKTMSPYHVLIANRDNLNAMKILLQTIFSLSVFLIEKREDEDLANPANKKKKISFKLGKGAESFLTHVLHCIRAAEIEENEGKEPTSQIINTDKQETMVEGSPRLNPRKLDGSLGLSEAKHSSSKSIEARSVEISHLLDSPKLVQKTKAKPDSMADSGVRELVFNVECMNARSIINELFESKNQERRKPVIAKGVRDTNPVQSKIKSLAFDIIKNIFYKHGAVEIDTPVFELKETLLGKYGEEGGKLIYDLNDQGGQLLSLRYDLTVPFARYLATNNLKKIKRFHIGKVYRRDQPDFTRGRFREFYQCDLDIAGSYDPMLPDAEILTIIHEIMSGLDVGKFEIKLCHRMLLEGIIALSGAPMSKFKAICSSIDKLDKEPWEAVANELVNEKGVPAEAVEKIKTFVQHRGKIDELIAKFDESKLFAEHENSVKALDELKLLSTYLKIFKSYDSITLDMSLARGLDYYTGLIYEVVVEGSKVGSVGAGGRYDYLVGMFGTSDIPCIGLSIGIERIFVLLEEKFKRDNIPMRENATEFLVATIGKNLVEHKLEMLALLWENGHKAEMLYENNSKPAKQLTAALETMTPYIIWLGEDEVKSSIVKIKVVYSNLVYIQEGGVHDIEG